MLLQSNENEISLLAACPKEWQTGNVKGLKARGTFVVDFSWKYGKVIYAKIKSLKDGSTTIK